MRRCGWIPTLALTAAERGHNPEEAQKKKHSNNHEKRGGLDLVAYWTVSRPGPPPKMQLSAVACAVYLSTFVVHLTNLQLAYLWLLPTA